MRVAIIHYWLVGMRGGEKVIEALCDMYPQADIFTHVYAPDMVSEKIRAHRIVPTFINSLPRAARMYKNYLPLMPLALEQLDLRGYDLIISSESGPAKGIIPPPGALHVCYCHTPMRYIWNMYHEYRDGAGALTRLLMPPLSHYLRMWDVSSAARVDSFVANSTTVAGRIRRYYGADSHVIHPPVDTEAFSPLPAAELGDFYLMAGELVAYKRPDLAIRAFNEMKLKLVVIGGGEMLQEVRRLAGPTITVLGSQPFSVLKDHYARCRALIFPGEEDFGMVPVEAMASGRPVIAYGRGGATETVADGLSGVFFPEQSVASIISAVERLNGLALDPAIIAAHAAQFGRKQFFQNMRAHIDGLLGAHLAPRATVSPQQDRRTTG
ncbi:MAG: glycosyltransferase [Bradyrhizobium sp.]|jgi:glycosyltransferase involved in cell wall biosynthesis|uniref:Glycosyltransferase n=1 Tax=Bradyrhizobium denitrificans TaxID=2734912 RepID=A0ABS5GBF5_9BRAD|nr:MULTISPECIES: glycosyltransferase [Bradyrhizobium]MBR1138446.1 glycosyltransferase [Bradyrhizobium denitrificans]MDU1491028.1 glycosyltransferase [Bradyrhizobium sp.]MDU1541206.1 glycosyltransferase [Bradyrhizobium sp.]MDU1665609.1 glycosyltransferase [Bradyrhizobium sp.]MDU1688490.1 glycosyltransferase [Bradyrhizobium sp.]